MTRSRHTFRPPSRLLAAVVGLTLVAAACGGDDDAEPAAEPTAEDISAEATDEATEDATETTSEATAETTSDGTADDEPFMIAVVAPSTVSDLAWTQALADGLYRLEDSRGLELAFSESLFVVEDAGAAIRDYADQGYDLIIAHGTQYGGSIQEIAPDYPETSFAYGTSTDTFGMPNVYAYTADAEEGGYVNGIMAAALTDDGIGIVGPVEAGDAKLYVDGFIEGATAGGATDVTATYTGSFGDVALASEAASAFVANGAGVLTGTSQSVVGAVGVAAENGIPFFATQSNQTQLAPDLIVASHVYHFEVILDAIISQIEAGTYGGESFGLTYANGGFVLEFNDGFDLDPAVKALGEDTVAAIIAGEIDPAGATG
jgi:basic membrane protein A and related proteins